MDIHTNDGCLTDVEDLFPLSGFLRKVISEEICHNLHNNPLVIAVHAVLLESGFVRISSNSDSSGFYTLPSIKGTSNINLLPLDNNNNHYPSVDFVVLNFQVFEKRVEVQGSLANPCQHGVYSVQLLEDELLPFLHISGMNSSSQEDVCRRCWALKTSPERVLKKFWMKVKDNLALPLMIDLCEIANLGLPSCFMRLPAEVKFRILELLPGADAAKTSCVCSDLRSLASSDDLWKRKFVEEFGGARRLAMEGSWKAMFVEYWKSRRSWPRELKIHLPRRSFGRVRYIKYIK